MMDNTVDTRDMKSSTCATMEKSMGKKKKTAIKAPVMLMMEFEKKKKGGK
jgi:hypothetical protein